MDANVQFCAMDHCPVRRSKCARGQGAKIGRGAVEYGVLTGNINNAGGESNGAGLKSDDALSSTQNPTICDVDVSIAATTCELSQ